MNGKRYYLIEPGTGYPLGGYKDEATAERTRKLPGREGQVVKALDPLAANALRRGVQSSRPTQQGVSKP